MSHINNIIQIAKTAAEAVLKVYDSGNFDVQLKSDSSPLTNADLIANEIIVSELGRISNFPVITEESPVSYIKRKDWQNFWLVDPLDGTKNFVARDCGFTINIALITDKRPVLGVVYLPVDGDVYFAEKGAGAFKNDSPIYNRSKRKNLIASDSVFHSSPEVKDFLSEHGISQVTKYGSSIKLCKLAEGSIDVYPRLNGTKEWDTAAGHIIANEAGCKLISTKTKRELTYNKKNIENDFFIASRNNLDFFE